MTFDRQARLWIGATWLITLVLSAACLFLRSGLLQIAISDIASALLMFSALCAFARNAFTTRGRTRVFWILQASGWAFWLADQGFWIGYDLVLQRKMPSMHPADALLFLAGAPMIAGLLLRPHREPAERSARLGALDFSLLMLWWLYLYVSFVVCWQYIWPSQEAYNRNFDLLSGAGTLLLTAILGLFWRASAGRWRTFFGAFFGAQVFYAFTFYLLNRAIELNLYYTGSWYDIPYTVAFAVFTTIGLMGDRLVPAPERNDNDSYYSIIANLAMVAVLTLPVIAFYALIDKRLPEPVSHFRVLVSLATMFLMATILFLQHYRLNGALRRTNQVLQEASLTDPLTGLRNRRYFSATIEADVGQALRSHADQHDPHTRDLVFYLIDADDFKDVNDRYGHDVGDHVLVEMAKRLSSSIRHSDVLVRWGGEEFLIVSRYTDRAEAELVAQRVLSAVADTPFEVGPGGQTMHRTCSMGWAAFPWYTNDPRALSYEEVLTLADRGLNRAKQAGKNRAIGMMPASGKEPATLVEGLHSNGLQVDVLAVSGPVSHS